MNVVKIINESKGWSAIEIPRCGCTTLKTLAFTDRHYKQPGSDIHRLLGYTEESSDGLIQEFDSNRNLFTFAVYRNPLERAISFFQSFTQNQDHIVPEFEWMLDCNFDTFCEYVRTLMTTNGSKNIDPHLKRQTDFYKLEDVDLIIPLNLLDFFLKTKFGYNKIPFTASSRALPLRHEITAPGISTLSSLYVEDLLIPYKYRFKIFNYQQRGGY